MIATFAADLLGALVAAHNAQRNAQRSAQTRGPWRCTHCGNTSPSSFDLCYPERLSSRPEQPSQGTTPPNGPHG